MGQLEHRRSQVIARLPVNEISATLIFHDGQRIEAVLFVPPGEHIATHFTETDPFLPVGLVGGIRLVARDTISCITVATYAMADSDLPQRRQQVAVRLCCGTMVEGELRWVAPPDRQRTADTLNDAARHLTLHGPRVTSYIPKSHVMWVEEH
jgi:hypothetical protein